MKFKLTLFTLAVIAACHSFSQTVLTNAVIKAKTETTRESSGGDADGGGPQIFMAGQDADIKVFLKADKYKMLMESNNMNTMVFVDKTAKTTTNLFEAMGNRNGYMQTDDEKAEARKAMDSAMKANSNNTNPTMGGFRVQDMRGNTTIEYTEETRVINKINCKKAIVTTKRQGNETKYDLWYCPDYILPEGIELARFTQIRDLKGIPVKFESVNKLNFGDREITMTTKFELTSLDLNAEIKDKEFVVPKDFEVKSWKEWQKQNGNGPGGPGRMMIFRN